jgi:hypothetical protein
MSVPIAEPHRTSDRRAGDPDLQRGGTPADPFAPRRANAMAATATDKRDQQAVTVRLPPGLQVFTPDAARALWELLFGAYNQHSDADREVQGLYCLQNSS